MTRRRVEESSVKEGYEGIVIALWMLLVSWVLIAVVKVLF